jgi:large subunit ribosomal protein L18
VSLNKKDQRLRRARQTRVRIATHIAGPSAEGRNARLAVHRTNLHIYASILSVDGGKVLASASTVEKAVREELGKAGKGGNTAAATLIGKRIAEKAKAAGIEKVAFDRSGFAYHGRVKALAEAAREAGLQF